MKVYKENNIEKKFCGLLPYFVGSSICKQEYFYVAWAYRACSLKKHQFCEIRFRKDWGQCKWFGPEGHISWKGD